jgi:hypothetical protein
MVAAQARQNLNVRFKMGFGSDSFNTVFSGMSAGWFGLFIANVFIPKIHFALIIGVPIATSALNFLMAIDISPVIPVFDVLFSVCFSFLLVRLFMSISRSLILIVPYESPRDKQTMVFIAFVSFSMVGYIGYENLGESDRNRLTYVCATWNLANLVLTLLTENGNISDYSCVLLSSAVYLLHDASGVAPYDTITVVRVLLATIGILSPATVLPSSEKEEEFSFFGIRKKRTRIILVAMMFSYFLVSPGSMWARGDESRPLLALLVPAIYSLLLTSEELGLARNRCRFG